MINEGLLDVTSLKVKMRQHTPSPLSSDILLEVLGQASITDIKLERRKSYHSMQTIWLHA